MRSEKLPNSSIGNRRFRDGNFGNGDKKEESRTGPRKDFWHYPVSSNAQGDMDKWSYESLFSSASLGKNTMVG